MKGLNFILLLSGALAMVVVSDQNFYNEEQAIQDMLSSDEEDEDNSTESDMMDFIKELKKEKEVTSPYELSPANDWETLIQQGVSPDDWDGKENDSPMAKLIQTMIIYDKEGNPHSPHGINFTSSKDSFYDNLNSKPYVHKSTKKDTTTESSSSSSTKDTVRKRVRRNYDKADNLWDKQGIPYVIGPGFTTLQTANIKSAIATINQKSCVVITPRANLPNKTPYLLFEKGAAACSSSVGKTGTNPQKIVIADKCATVKGVLKGILHTLGAHHEHQRTDRDNYIQVIEANIKDSLKPEFTKKNTHDRTNYDLSSILQVPLTEFKKDGTPPNTYTMRARDRKLEILVGSSSSLTYTDIKEINLAYKCNENCPPGGSCKNEGFINKDCKCECPDPLTGNDCSKVKGDSCSKTIDLTTTSMVEESSQNHPNAYTSGTVCTYLVKGPDNTRIKLSIQELDLLRSSKTCIHWMEVRHNSISQDGIRFCNTGHGFDEIVTSNDARNMLLLRFDSRAEGQVSLGQRYKFKVERIGPFTCASNPSPCKNGAPCETSGTGYICKCTPTWTGPNCEENVKSCQANSCNGHGTCVDVGNMLQCTCNAEWTGPTCKDAKCEKDSCKNSGTCTIENNAIKCQCKPGFTGSRCTVLTCDTGNPCKNMGSCVKNGAVSQCKCTTGWTGPLCETKAEVCKPDSCLNGGVCSTPMNVIKCTCKPEWEGKFCQTAKCEAMSCKNSGTCSVESNAIKCKCTSEYRGIRCEEKVPMTCSFEPGKDCWLTQSNNVLKTRSASIFTVPNTAFGGTHYGYINSNEKFTMTSKSGNIKPNTDYCISLGYYMTGQAFLTIFRVTPSFSRFSSDGKWKYEELTVSTAADQNDIKIEGTTRSGTIAIDEITLAQGKCKDPCTSSPCKNNGDCKKKSSTEFECKCKTPYTGKTCTEKDPCLNLPCLNGGKCTKKSDTDFECKCQIPYTGKTCSERNPCLLSPCLNGGICTRKSNTEFECKCQSPYTGATCSETGNIGIQEFSCTFDLTKQCAKYNFRNFDRTTMSCSGGSSGCLAPRRWWSRMYYTGNEVLNEKHCFKFDYYLRNIRTRIWVHINGIRYTFRRNSGEAVQWKQKSYQLFTGYKLPVIRITRSYNWYPYFLRTKIDNISLKKGNC